MGNDDKRLVDKQQRDDLRKLLAAATPGAWWTGTGEHWGRDVRPNVAFCGGPNGVNDARLIAEMSKALPALLDALDAAEPEIEQLRAELDAAEARERAKDERIRELEEHYASARRVCEEAQAIARARQDEVAAIEARIRELTEWVRGEPDNNSRHWALVLHDSAKVPRVMQWEPKSSMWCGDGVGYDPDECEHLPTLPLPSTEGGEG